MNIGVTEERKAEVDKVVEEGPWSNRTEYLRTILRVGESDFATLDPRTSDGQDGRDETESPLEISDTELLAELRRQAEETDEEYVPVEEVVKPFLEDLDQELTDKLLEMGIDDSTGVETDGRGGYKLETQE